MGHSGWANGLLEVFFVTFNFSLVFSFVELYHGSLEVSLVSMLLILSWVCYYRKECM